MPIVHPFPYFAGFEPANPYLPSFYAQADDLEQRIMHLCKEYCKLIQFTDSMVDTLNDSYAVIEDMQEKLPGLIDDATAEEIGRLVESGQFAEMVQAALEQSASEYYAGAAPISFPALVGTLPYTDDGFTSLQGGCWIDDTTFVQAQIGDSGSRLRKFSTDGSLLASYTYPLNDGAVEHFNSCAYLDGYIYATGMTVSSAANDMRVYKINAANFADYEILEFTGITLFTSVSGIAVIDGRMFISSWRSLSYQMKIAEVNPGTLAMIAEKELDDVPYIPFCDLCNWHGTLAALYYNGAAALISTDLEIFGFKSIDQTISGVFTATEFEWLDTSPSGTVYASAHCNYNGRGRTYAIAEISGIRQSTRLQTISATYSPRTVTVDYTKQDAWTREGTSAAPFAAMSEALQHVRANPGVAFSINVVSSDDMNIAIWNDIPNLSNVAIADETPYDVEIVLVNVTAPPMFNIGASNLTAVTLTRTSDVHVRTTHALECVITSDIYSGLVFDSVPNDAVFADGSDILGRVEFRKLTRITAESMQACKANCKNGMVTFTPEGNSFSIKSYTVPIMVLARVGNFGLMPIPVPENTGNNSLIATNKGYAALASNGVLQGAYTSGDTSTINMVIQREFGVNVPTTASTVHVIGL